MPASIGKIKYGSTAFRFGPIFQQDGVPVDLVAAGCAPSNFGVTFRQQTGQGGGVDRTGNGTWAIIQTGQGQGAVNMGFAQYSPSWGSGQDLQPPPAGVKLVDYEAEFFVTLPAGPNPGLLLTDTVAFQLEARL